MPDFNKYKVPELKKQLLALGLSDKGKKSDLVDRLTQHATEQKQAAAAPAPAGYAGGGNVGLAAA